MSNLERDASTVNFTVTNFIWPILKPRYQFVSQTEFPEFIFWSEKVVILSRNIICCKSENVTKSHTY